MKSTKYLLLLLLLSLTACGERGGHWLRRLEHFEEMNRTDKPLSVDSVLPLVRHYDHWWHSSLLRLRAYYMLGSAYRDQGEAPAALHYYHVATERADTAHADSATCAILFRVYGQMATLYEQEDMPYEQLKVLSNCAHFALLAKDTLSHILSYEHMTGAYYAIGDTTKVLQLTEEARQQYIKYGNRQWAASVYPVAIYVSLNNSNYPRARRFMDIFEQESGMFDKSGCIELGRELYYDAQGQYYKGIGYMDSAEYYFRKVLEYYPYEGYKGLLAVYLERKNIDSIAKYSTLHEQALLEWQETRQTEAIIRSSSMYNYERNQRIAMESTQKAERLKLLGILIFIIALSAILITYRHYRSRVQEQETKLRELGRRYTSATKEYIQLVEEFRILKHEYDNSEASKEAKALIEKKQNRIAQLEETLDQYQADLNLLKYAEREKLLKENDIVAYFVEKTKIAPKWKAPEDEKWESLSVVYDQYMPLASARMERVKLSRQERLTCILTHLNFIPSDIATLLDTRNSRISNAKKTASKKLFGDEESKILRQRIIDIECRDN